MLVPNCVGMNPSVLPLTEAAASADGKEMHWFSDPGRDPKRDRSDGWRSENTTGDSGESAVAPLNVVIAYDDIPAGQRALSMLTRLLGQEIQNSESSSVHMAARFHK